MKKRICLILSVLLGVLLVFAVCSCSKNEEDSLKKEIVSAYIQQHNLKLGKDETLTVELYGKFDGVYVVYFHGLLSGQAMTDLTVNGVDYHFRNTQVFDVYRDGKFYTLQEAFDNSYLTRADLVTVREKHKAEEPSLYVNADFDNKIKAAYLQTLLGGGLTVYDLTLRHIVNLGGTYIVRITGPWDDSRNPYPYVIGNVFFDPEMDYIAYCNGKIYSIRDAFESKLLTYDNLLTLQIYRKAAAPGYFDVHDTITQEIVSAYAAMRGIPESNVEQPIFYGIFTNCHVMIISEKSYSGSADGPQIEGGVAAPLNVPMGIDLIVDDVYFHPIRTFIVYHDGKFYTLQEAFDNGYLTHSSLLEVQRNHRALFPEDYFEYEELTKEITEAYAATRSDITADDVSLSYYGYYSTFEEYVMIISVRGDSVAQVETTRTVSGVQFHFPNDQDFTVYREGEFYTLQEMYDNNKIHYWQLLEIQLAHATAYPELYRKYNETNREIIDSYVRKNPECKKEDLSFQCYGEFGDTYVLMIRDRSCADATESECMVDGVLFCFNVNHFFQVYRDGEFYSLQEAFENGYLSHDDLLTVQRNHKSEYSYGYHWYENTILLDAARKSEIISAFIAEHDGYYPYVALRCYGAFDDTFVLYVEVERPDEVYESVAGIDFSGRRGLMTVYRDGTFYSLSEAYENGLLSYDELLEVKNVFSKKHN